MVDKGRLSDRLASQGGVLPQKYTLFARQSHVSRWPSVPTCWAAAPPGARILAFRVAIRGDIFFGAGSPRRPAPHRARALKRSAPNAFADAGDLSRVHAAWCSLGQPFTAGGPRRSETFSPFQRASLFSIPNLTVRYYWRSYTNSPPAGAFRRIKHEGMEEVGVCPARIPRVSPARGTLRTSSRRPG